MNRQFLYLCQLTLIAGLVSPPAYADKISTELKVELQTAMLAYNDSILVDGSYSYLDTRLDAMRTAYPANAHPFVVTLGEDYFVCSEFINDKGNTITADYLVREIGKQYKVVQMILDDRESLRLAMQKMGN